MTQVKTSVKQPTQPIHQWMELLHSAAGFCWVFLLGKHHVGIMVVEMVPLKGGRDYITPQKAIYKWYILPIGGLYATYHLLREPETTIDVGIMPVIVHYATKNAI